MRICGKFIVYAESASDISEDMVEALEKEFNDLLVEQLEWRGYKNIYLTVSEVERV